jgi:CRISPR-associated protein Cas5h
MGFDPVGRECCSFTVRGDWAHFRRLDTTTTKETYRVIPRTTAAGLIGAILGKPRDSYYESFQRACSAIAIEPLSPVSTMAIPMVLPKTDSFVDLHETPDSVDDIEVPAIGRIPDPQGERMRNTFEYLTDVAYRIHVTLEDEAMQAALVEAVTTGVATFTPYLGKSECLASVTEGRTATIKEGPTENHCTVESTAPANAVRPSPDAQYHVERTPASMKTDDGGRYTNEFVSYLYNPTGGSIDGVDSSVVASVDGTPLAFV